MILESRLHPERQAVLGLVVVAAVVVAGRRYIVENWTDRPSRALL